MSAERRLASSRDAAESVTPRRLRSLPTTLFDKWPSSIARIVPRCKRVRTQGASAHVAIGVEEGAPNVIVSVPRPLRRYLHAASLGPVPSSILMVAGWAAS